MNEWFLKCLHLKVSVYVHAVMPIGDKMHRLVGAHIGDQTNSSLEPWRVGLSVPGFSEVSKYLKMHSFVFVRI